MSGAERKSETRSYPTRHWWLLLCACECVGGRRVSIPGLWSQSSCCTNTKAAVKHGLNMSLYSLTLWLRSLYFSLLTVLYSLVCFGSVYMFLKGVAELGYVMKLPVNDAVRIFIENGHLTFHWVGFWWTELAPSRVPQTPTSAFQCRWRSVKI